MTTARNLDLTESNIVNEIKSSLHDEKMFLHELKVPSVKIDKIFHERESTPDRISALTEGISYWLHTTEKPTWEDIAIALEKCSCYKVAWRVRSKSQGNVQLSCILISLIY